MKKRTRYIIIFLFFLCFAITSLVMVFYAMGYRYDFKEKSLKKVGMLIIESKPKDVQLFINGKYKDYKTPTRIKNLLPGDYTITLTKEGYNNWEKRLTVKSQFVTWVRYAHLFPINPKKSVLLNEKIQNFKLSPNNQKIVYAVESGENKELWLFDLKSKKTSKLFPKLENDLEKIKSSIQSLETDITFSDLKWSKDDQKLLFAWSNTGQNYKHYAITNISKQNEILFLQEFINSPIENVKWSYENNKIFLVSQKILYQLNLDSKELTKTPLDNILDYDINKQGIFYIQEKNDAHLDGTGTISLLRASYSFKEIEPLSTIPENEEKYEIIIGSSKYIALKLGKNQSLYIFNKENNLKKIKDGVRDIQWSVDGKKLLYRTDYEIWVLILEEIKKISGIEELNELEEEEIKESELITRYSEKIGSMLWFSDFNHIVFVVKDSVKIIELDRRNKRNVFDLVKTSEYNPIVSLDDKGEKLYFMDQINGQETLCEAILTES